MKIALAITCSEKLAKQTVFNKVNFTMEDGTVMDAPILFLEGNINDLRRQLYYIADTLCDRSCFKDTGLEGLVK